MFTPRNKETACGMYSLTYFIALAITLALVILALFFSRKLKEKDVKKIILGVGIFAVATEVIKQIFFIVNYGWDEFEPIPMYFCSMLLYCPWLAVSKNKHVRLLGTTFLTMGGILGAIAFFAYPNSCIPNYPIYHFMCLRTMIFHGSMIYLGLLLLITGYSKPKLSDFKYFVIVLGTACIISYIWNMIFNDNMMYISEPLGISFADKIYDATGFAYPFIFMILESTVPFFISYGIYKLVLYFCSKKTKEE